MAIKRIAIIGVGPAGAISIDSFAQEQAFDIIRVFERREAPGGCWLFDKQPHHPFTDIDRLAARTADAPIEIPDKLPAQTPKQNTIRYEETSIYPYLETNVDARSMEFTKEPIPVRRSPRSISFHGSDTPFRSHEVIREYIENLVSRNGYPDLIEYNTTVERATKKNGEWELILRKKGESKDYWWIERFDAVVVANGHYTVPYFPHTEGLQEFEEKYPGSVEHSKAYRGREKYRGKRVIVVGASISGGDAAFDLIGVAQNPIYAVVEGHRSNVYFGDWAFQHPEIKKVPSIKRVEWRDREVIFEDGHSVQEVDTILFATGYTWSLPFLPQIPVRNNRVPDLYLHIFHQNDPTLVFVGAVAAGFTFKVFEWQAVLAARVLAGRATLPPLIEQQKWEQNRISEKGDGVPFTTIYPSFQEYFETIRGLAGEPLPTQPGRRLPPFDLGWLTNFFDGHERRKNMWKRANKDTEERVNAAKLIIAKL